MLIISENNSPSLIFFTSKQFKIYNRLNKHQLPATLQIHTRIAASKTIIKITYTFSCSIFEPLLMYEHRNSISYNQDVPRIPNELFLAQG